MARTMLDEARAKSTMKAPRGRPTGGRANGRGAPKPARKGGSKGTAKAATAPRAGARASGGRSRSRPATRPDWDQLEGLLLQSLETEQAGLEVYDMAIRCADREDLREEWLRYRAETREHERILYDVCDGLGIDPGRLTPERELVRRMGRDLVSLMERAFDDGTRESAQLVAAECVVHAETKGHLNWSLLAQAAKALDGKDADLLQEACDEVEGQKDEHLYHTMGWTRELWLDSLRLPAVLPPPEERMGVRSQAGAARAKKARGAMPKAGTRRAKEATARRDTGLQSRRGKATTARGTKAPARKATAKGPGNGAGRRVPPGVRKSLAVTSIRTNETATNDLRPATAGMKPQSSGQPSGQSSGSSSGQPSTQSPAEARTGAKESRATSPAPAARSLSPRPAPENVARPEPRPDARPKVVGFRAVPADDE